MDKTKKKRTMLMHIYTGSIYSRTEIIKLYKKNFERLWRLYRSRWSF